MQILRNIDIEIEHEQMMELYKRLDTTNKGVIYFTEFDKLFSQFLEDDTKNLVINLKN